MAFKWIVIMEKLQRRTSIYDNNHWKIIARFPLYQQMPESFLYSKGQDHTRLVKIKHFIIKSAV